jgi:Type II secretion system (T2SS), protein F
MIRDRSRARGSRRRVPSPGSGSSRGWFPPEGREPPEGWAQVVGRGWPEERTRVLGRGSRWGWRSRRRRRRSATLGDPPILGRRAGAPGPAGSAPPDAAGLRGQSPGTARLDAASDPGQSPRPALRPPGVSAWPGARRRRRRGGRHGGGLEALRRRLPAPGRAAAVRREMEAAVPEVVDVLRATVAAGINPRRALQAAAEGAPSALESVLDQAIRAAELGAGAGHALATAARAERLSELVLAGEALDLAETTGAPPGPVLAGVAAAAADRVRSRQAMLAATAEARLSARVVAAMAPAFLGVLALTSPSDAAFLVREPAGWATLAAAATLEVLGISWSTHIVRGPAP